jgi:hypothetical protein
MDDILARMQKNELHPALGKMARFAFSEVDEKRVKRTGNVQGKGEADGFMTGL